MKDDVSKDEFITRQEAAAELKVCLTTLDKLINSKNFYGKLKIGRKVLINKTMLDKYLQTLYK